MLSDDEEEHERALQCDCIFKLTVPPPQSPRQTVLKFAGSSSVPVSVPSAPVLGVKKHVQLAVTTATYDSTRRRLFYGLNTGEFCFWQLNRDGAGSSRFVGSHKGPVTCICVPRKEDGDLGTAGLILSGSADGNIKIWDYQGRVMLEPTTCVQTLYGHSGTITDLFVYGPHVVSSSTDKTIRVWKAVEGRQHLLYPWYDLQATVASLGGWVRSMSFDRSNSVGDLGTFYAVDETGAVLKVVPEEAVDDEGKRALNKGYNFTVDGYVSMGTTSSSSALPVMMRHTHDRGVLKVRYVAAWQMLLTLCYDNCLRTYDTITGDAKHCWENESRAMFTDLEVDVQYGEILTVDKMGCLAIFSTKTGRLMATKQLTRDPIVTIRRVLASQHYAVMTEKELSVWFVEHELDYNVLRGGHEKAVVALYTCSGGVGASPGDADYRIFSASHDNTLRLWDPADLSCLRVMNEAKSEVTAMTFYEAWNILVTGHDSGDIRLWDLDTGSSQTLRQHTNAVTCLTLALMRKNEELLISGSYDGLVILWDIRSLRNEPPHMISKFRAHGMDKPPASPSLQVKSNAARTGSITGAPPAAPTAGGSGSGAAPLPAALTLAALEPEILCVRYDPVKKVIITAGNDKHIKVWSINGYLLQGQHVGHTDAVTCLAIDANFLFSGSEDCTIRLWDTVPAGAHTAVTASRGPSSSGLPAAAGDAAGGALGGDDAHNSEGGVCFMTRALKVLHGHTRCVTALEVAPSGHLLSCSLDGNLLFWDYITGTVLHKFTHHEEFRCMALRYDRDEVLVGTQQASILRYALPQELLQAATSAVPQLPPIGGASTFRSTGRSTSPPTANNSRRPSWTGISSNALTAATGMPAASGASAAATGMPAASGASAAATAATYGDAAAGAAAAGLERLGLASGVDDDAGSSGSTEAAASGNGAAAAAPAASRPRAAAAAAGRSGSRLVPGGGAAGGGSGSPLMGSASYGRIKVHAGARAAPATTGGLLAPRIAPTAAPAAAARELPEASAAAAPTAQG